MSSESPESSKVIFVSQTIERTIIPVGDPWPFSDTTKIVHVHPLGGGEDPDAALVVFYVNVRVEWI